MKDHTALTSRRILPGLIGLACLMQAILCGCSDHNKAETLFRCAVVADIHMTRKSEPRFLEFCEYINARPEIGFVIFLGDNSAIDPGGREESLAVRRHRYFQSFLAAHLDRPALVLPGDNWGMGFEKVFGPFQAEYACGGVRFLTLAMDRTAGRAEGCSLIETETRTWLRKRLAESGGGPVLALSHEPVIPPSFLEATRIHEILAQSGVVVLALAGHLHQDVDLTLGGIRYVTLPSFGLSPGSPFRLLEIGRNSILIRNFKRTASAGWMPAATARIVRLRPPLSAALRAPETAIPRRIAARPARPCALDPALVARQNELVLMALDVARRLATEALGSGAKPQPFPHPATTNSPRRTERQGP